VFVKGPVRAVRACALDSRARQSAEATEQLCRGRALAKRGPSRSEDTTTLVVVGSHGPPQDHLRDRLATRRAPLLLRGSSVTERLRVAGER
jgi:hypothetical protein